MVPVIEPPLAFVWSITVDVDLKETSVHRAM